MCAAPLTRALSPFEHTHVHPTPETEKPEAETLAQVHSILGDHGLLDEHVTSLLACEEGRRDVTIAKKRGA